MTDNTDFKFFNEADAHHWVKRMFVQSMEPSTLMTLIPKPAPLTRTQRWRRNIRWKIETARLRVGSWIAGVDLDER